MATNRSKFTKAVSTIALTFCLSSIGACTVKTNHSPANASAKSSETPQSETFNAEFLELAERHAGKILATSPEWATQLGVDEAVAGAGFRGRLSDFSATVFDQL